MFSKNQLEKLRIMYLSGCSYAEMRKELNCLDSRITFWVHKLNLPMRGSGRKNTYQNPFINKSPETDYWLGYLFADGHIQHGHIVLFSKEKEVIDAFNKFCNNNCKIRKRSYKIKSGEQRIMYNCDLISTVISDWFIKTYNISSKKAKSLDPNIELNWDILRGYFDGDGSAHKKGGWTVTTGSEVWAKRIKEFLIKNNINPNINVYGNDCYKVCVWKKEDLKKLVKNMYKNKIFYLEYKFKRLEPYISDDISKSDELLEA